MNKEQQDLSWQRLPKEERNKIISVYACKNGSNSPYNEGYRDALKQLFGHHNLTSDEEPSEPETKDNMETKELNLCELLKGCEKEKFYSPMWSNVFIAQLRETSIRIVPCDEGYSERFLFIDKCGVWTKGGQCILYPSRALYEKYPLDAYSAWMEWQSERTPKRWRANVGGVYWRINVIGDAIVTNEYNTDVDNDCYNFGNYFCTKEEAKQAAEAVRECLMKFHEKNSEK